MNNNRRILINILATYGRSLIALVCGLFSARWVLGSLGEVDYGLFGVVGGLVGLVGFLNDMMSSAVGRFYAYAVGSSQRKGEKERGLEDCRRWFSTSLAIHFVLAVIMMVIGYPLGSYVINHIMVIPHERLAACEWVWIFSCVTCFVSVVTVPFQAMYIAKQNIAQLTIYTLFTTFVSFVFTYYMTLSKRDWLIPYAAAMCVALVIPRVVATFFAFRDFAECRIVRAALSETSRYRQLISFAASRFVKAVSDIVMSQGLSLSINYKLGPTANAAMTVGQSVSSHTMSLASSMSGAFWPAIANARGAGNIDEMTNLTFRTCKFCAAAFAVFAVPLILEIDYILAVWLVNPPSGSQLLSALVLISQFLVLVTEGYWMALYAEGKVWGYQTSVACMSILSLVITVICLFLGFGVVGAGIGFIVSRAGVSLIRLYFGRYKVGLSVLRWARSIFVPLVLSCLVSSSIGCILKKFLDPSLARLIIITFAFEIVFISLIVTLVMDRAERMTLVNLIAKRLPFLRTGLVKGCI